MSEVSSTYHFYQEYHWLKEKAIRFAPEPLDEVIGVNKHYGLSDFRL